MKAIKTIKTIGLLCLAIPLLSSCQIYDIVKDATDQEEGRIVMKDGRVYRTCQNAEIKHEDSKHHDNKR